MKIKIKRWEFNFQKSVPAILRNGVLCVVHFGW